MLIQCCKKIKGGVNTLYRQGNTTELIKRNIDKYVIVFTADLVLNATAPSRKHAVYKETMVAETSGFVKNRKSSWFSATQFKSNFNCYYGTAKNVQIN